MKGFVGEAKVALGARLALPSAAFRRFHNVTLRMPDGTTQIDHVFVSRFGVFVVETKNMGGWVFGNERHRRWTQVFRGGKKYTFQNPLRQNNRHVKAVEAVLAPLDLDAGTVRSVVVFVGEATLKTAMPANVTTGMGFARHIKSFRTAVLSGGQVDEICALIEAGCLAQSWETRCEHVRNVRRRLDPAAGRTCPRCGKPMVLRAVKRGEHVGRRFWGCTGFPSCRARHAAE